MKPGKSSNARFLAVGFGSVEAGLEQIDSHHNHIMAAPIGIRLAVDHIVAFRM